MVLRVLVAIALLCSVAHAGDKPWAAGVAPEKQKIALAKYDEANELFEKGNYLEALPIYLEALQHWDHPGIQYNTVVCLINLDRIVEAYEHLEKAMAYGEAPLGRDLYKQGQTYQRMLGKQIARLELTLKTKGGTVQIDGKPVLVDAGTTTITLLATEHRLVADKPGYDPQIQTIKLSPGEPTVLVIEMKLKARGKTVRRWARWKPWAVVGASSAIALTGGFVAYSSKAMFDTYDANFARGCSGGCPATSDPAAGDKSAAESRQILGWSIVAAGGATLVTGLVLVVFNQPRLVGASVTPMVGTEHAGAVLTLPW